MFSASPAAASFDNSRSPANPPRPVFNGHPVGAAGPARAVALSSTAAGNALSRELSYTRHSVVGDGTIQSVAERAWELRGEIVGTVAGTVFNADGSLARDARVTLLTASLSDSDTHAINQTQTASDGSYRISAPPVTFSACPVM